MASLALVAIVFMSMSFWITSGLLCMWATLIWFRLRIKKSIHKNRTKLLRDINYTGHDQPTFLGFFHPYCAAGGGGERVLWTAVRDVQREFQDVICVVYTGDLDVSREQMILRVKSSFDISLDARRLAIIHLRSRYLVEDDRYPRFTLLLQSLASMKMGYEAISNLVPDVYFDTMGYAFTFPLVHYLTHISIAAYVHYPTISSDMLQRVYERRAQYNNDKRLANSWLWTTAKLIYYRLFARVYSYCGSFAQVVMVNSSWTKNHIDQLWSTDADIVYPPCDTDRLGDLSLDGRKSLIVSVAQFRPEKDHRLQILAMARLFEKYPQWLQDPNVKLIMVGSCRNKGDEERIDQLRNLAKELQLQDRIHFEVNAPYNVLVSLLGQGKVGLHTMWNEHFGIGVVEYQTAGLIVVAHCSGGPKMDIVVDYANQPTGFLADNADSFADRLHDALSLSENEYKEMASNARASASDRFSELAFSVDLLRPLRRCLT